MDPLVFFFDGFLDLELFLELDLEDFLDPLDAMAPISALGQSPPVTCISLISQSVNARLRATLTFQFFCFFLFFLRFFQSYQC